MGRGNFTEEFSMEAIKQVRKRARVVDRLWTGA
jgi:hypothetical protein